MIQLDGVKVDDNINKDLINIQTLALKRPFLYILEAAAKGSKGEVI